MTRAIQHHSLSEIQQAFANALIHPEAAADVAAMLVPHSFQDDRLALYRGNLTAIWLAALGNAYPVLRQLVGDDYFEQVARAFGRTYPSISGDLNQFGTQLPGFLSEIPDAADYPYFPEVARLEWQVHNAYYASDAESFSLPGFVQLIAGKGLALPDVVLGLHPAVSLYQSDWASVAIWHAHQAEPGMAAPENIRQGSFGLISRKQWQVELTVLTGPAFLALQALQQGVKLGDALEIAVGADTDFDINAHLQSWFNLGLFTQIKISEMLV
ncbi:putative DNA-binding domain-containing protein [Undibacterium sp. TJN19]|uniref:HvfC/BufC family peptide modification chaperone n=1 Tax=Undibacterium sp. TJN19 TaxID=3413055 RepID=UPI003BF25BEE